MRTGEHWCGTCGGYLHSLSPHKCPPRFECRLDEDYKDDRDWTDTYAHSAETAAEKYAEQRDCENEYWMLREGDRCEAVIEVRDASGAITRWSIRAESVPHYYADQIEE